MKKSRCKQWGIGKPIMRTILILSPPNLFIGGPGSDSPGFPLKTCGNDGLRIDCCEDAANYGECPQAIQNAPRPLPTSEMRHYGKIRAEVKRKHQRISRRSNKRMCANKQIIR